jgi:hypothetical protein
MHLRFTTRATSISFVKRTPGKPLRVICRDGKLCKIRRRSQEEGRNEKNDEAELSTWMA